MNKMIAITINPGATTAAVRLIVFGHAATSSHHDQKERAQQLRKQPPPLLRRILKVLEYEQEPIRRVLREFLELAELPGRLGSDGPSSAWLNRFATHLTLLPVPALGRAAGPLSPPAKQQPINHGLGEAFCSRRSTAGASQ
jgi:hypothetical protein